MASAIAADLGQIDPAHASYYTANAAKFTASLAAWDNATTAFKAAHPGIPVATTEPVADYLLQALGADNMTPWAFQADIMNGTDPSPQDVATENSLFTQHKVKVFLYNQQVTDASPSPSSSWRARTASRSSASMRPCRPRGSTTSPGCSPRSTLWTRP